MSLLDQLLGASGPVSKQRKKPVNKPYEARRIKADAAYQALLKNKALTTGEIASALGHTHCGALSSLMKLEKRGLVVRAGIRPRESSAHKGRGATIWRWADEHEDNAGGNHQD